MKDDSDILNCLRSTAAILELTGWANPPYGFSISVAGIGFGEPLEIAFKTATNLSPVGKVAFAIELLQEWQEEQEGRRKDEDEYDEADHLNTYGTPID